MIKECRDQISSLKDLYDVEKITHDFQVLREQYTVERRPVRKRAIPQGFDGYIVDAPNETHSSSMSDEESDVIQELRRVIVELSDCFEREMNSRFSSENTDL